jgi:16S rRNA (uracil1498-N3)-methyltransferase
MSRRRFFVPGESIRNGTACLPADQAHHLRNVLRLRNGDVVEIFDGKGVGYSGAVDFQDAGIFVRELRKLPTGESGVRVVLAAALIKPSKFDWILQKATELGVQDIIPLNTRRSDVGIPGGMITGRRQRWDRIVMEASKQCRRSSLPRVHEPQSFRDFLSMKDLSSCARFMLHEKASEPWNPDSMTLSEGVILCIGPEGGWDDDEVERAQAAGYEVFSLGPWILRAETASIAAVSILQHRIHLLTSNLQCSKLHD